MVTNKYIQGKYKNTQALFAFCTLKWPTLNWCKEAEKFVVVVLLFYIHGKHLRSCRDGQLT